MLCVRLIYVLKGIDELRCNLACETSVAGEGSSLLEGGATTYNALFNQLERVLPSIKGKD